MREKLHEARDSNGVMWPQTQGHQKLEEAEWTLPRAFRVRTALGHVDLGLQDWKNINLWFKLSVCSQLHGFPRTLGEGKQQLVPS